ncbi:uncharacterized protein LOC123300172 [Chrysoperla carnea]|uniref:uncharacterized protein LOC123300172 n=1 Tax=Chrysoperla carnea TaxID=189513 RepID=UPI001D079963|nr:uncharacterized protein LOC123300172 [Chrysoperla carnea]
MELKKQNNLLYVLLSVLLLHNNLCLCSLFWGNGKNPADLTRCYLGREPEMLVIDVGETKRLPNACCSVHCQEDLIIRGTCCGVVSGPPECTKTRPNLALPYPDCCPTILCPNHV